MLILISQTIKDEDETVIPDDPAPVEPDTQKDSVNFFESFVSLIMRIIEMIKSVFEELIWKLNGDTNIRFLVEHNNHIWTEWPFKQWLQQTGQTEIIHPLMKKTILILAFGLMSLAAGAQIVIDLPAPPSDVEEKVTNFTKRFATVSRLSYFLVTATS